MDQDHTPVPRIAPDEVPPDRAMPAVRLELGMRARHAGPELADRQRALAEGATSRRRLLTTDVRILVPQSGK